MFAGFWVDLFPCGHQSSTCETDVQAMTTVLLFNFIGSPANDQKTSPFAQYRQKSSNQVSAAIRRDEKSVECRNIAAEVI